MEIRDIVLQHLVVKQTLLPNMRYVEGSAHPEPKTVSPNRDILAWDTNFVPTSGLTYTLWLEPLEAGSWPTSSRAELTFWDRWGAVGRQAFPVPWVQVLVPRAVETPSAPRSANRSSQPQP